jgi:hypothetical protein
MLVSMEILNDSYNILAYIFNRKSFGCLQAIIYRYIHITMLVLNILKDLNDLNII